MTLVLWEGPEEAPGGPGMGGHGSFCGGLAVASGARVVAKAEAVDLAEARPRGQVAPHYQAGLPGQGLLARVSDCDLGHSAPGWRLGGKAIMACTLLPKLCDLEKAALPL